MRWEESRPLKHYYITPISCLEGTYAYSEATEDGPGDFTLQKNPKTVAKLFDFYNWFLLPSGKRLIGGRFISSYAKLLFEELNQQAGGINLPHINSLTCNSLASSKRIHLYSQSRRDSSK